MSKPQSDGILFTVCSYVSELLEVEMAALEAKSVLLELGAQSFDFLNLVFRLERKFGVELPPSYSIPERHSIAAFVDAVESALAARPRA